MSILSNILLVIGFLSLSGGISSLSNATAGVGGVAAACFLGIVARMAAGVTSRLFDVSDLVALLIESESKKAA